MGRLRGFAAASCVNHPNRYSAAFPTSSTDALRGVVNASFRGELGKPRRGSQAFQLAATALLCDEDRALFRPWPGGVGGVLRSRAAALVTTSTRRARWAVAADVAFVGGSLACASRRCRVRMRWCRGCGISCCTARTEGWLDQRRVRSGCRPDGSIRGRETRRGANKFPDRFYGLSGRTNCRRFADQGEGEARETRRAGREWLRTDDSTRTDENLGEFELEFELEEEKRRIARLLQLGGVLSIAPARTAMPPPGGSTSWPRWSPSSSLASDLLRYPIASERNAWAVNMLTFTRDASAGDEAKADGDRLFEPSSSSRAADVEVTDANKAVRRGAGASPRDAFARRVHARGCAIDARGSRRRRPSRASSVLVDDLRRLVCGVDELCRAWRAATRTRTLARGPRRVGAGGVVGNGPNGGASGGPGGEPAIVGWFSRRRAALRRAAATLLILDGSLRWGRRGSPVAGFVYAGAPPRAGVAAESQTCSRTIKLAEYRSFEQMRSKLMMALDFGAAGFAFA